MGETVDIPLTDESVDPTDPVGTVKTIMLLIAGIAVLLIAFAFGQDAAGAAQQKLAEVLGLNTGSGQTVEIV